MIKFGLPILIILILIIPESRCLLLRWIRKLIRIVHSDGEFVINRAVELGGVRQFVQIRGFDINNPILLIIHGGPGWSETCISYDYQRRLSKKYCIVNWDQRCVGETALLSGASSVKEIHINDIVSDAQELARYLTETYHKDKIIVMGHSWGSVVGAILAYRSPELVSGYIGWGQVVNLFKAEEVAYAHSLKLAHDKGDAQTVGLLEGIRPYPSMSDAPDELRRKITVSTDIKYKYGYGSVKYSSTRSFVRANVQRSLANPDFHLAAIRYIGNEEPYSFVMGSELLSFDLVQECPEFCMPVIFIFGDNDWQTPYTIAEDYLGNISAPYKQFYLVKNSGHSTTFDNTDGFVELLMGPIYNSVCSDR